MSADITQIKQHIADLEAALVDPAISVEYEGKKVVLGDSADIEARLGYFRRKLNNLSSSGKCRGPRRTTVYTNSRKGL